MSRLCSYRCCDGLEKVDFCKIWPFLVSMLDFWGVNDGINLLSTGTGYRIAAHENT